jgi:hypothetical protein
VTVSVSFDVPLFVPFISKLFDQKGNGHHTVTAVATMPVDPCSVD